jgi:hypothetical protein
MRPRRAKVVTTTVTDLDHRHRLCAIIVALVWILYAVAGVGMVGPVVLVKDSYRPAPKQ